eukprot:tig00000114_g6056.t1
MPATNTTLMTSGFTTPDWQGITGTAANAGTDSVTWDGSYASNMTVKLQNPVMLRVTSNDFESPVSCSVYVYFDIDGNATNTVNAEEAEALWLSGLLKKIEPSSPDRPSVRVLELKFTPDTSLYRQLNGGSQTNIDGSTTGSTRAVPSEMYNLWKMTAKEMMSNATTTVAPTTFDAKNPRTQVWPRLAFNKFTFKLFNNIAGMPTSGLVVGSTLMAELVSACADLTTASSDGALTYLTAVTNREMDSKIYIAA